MLKIKEREKLEKDYIQKRVYLKEQAIGMILSSCRVTI